jgi:hypothetical protein
MATDKTDECSVQCDWCGEHIQPGEMVHTTADGRHWCDHCETNSTTVLRVTSREHHCDCGCVGPREHATTTWEKRDRRTYLRESERLVALLTAAARAMAAGADAQEDVRLAVKAADRFHDAWAECPCGGCAAATLEAQLRASVQGAA